MTMRAAVLSVLLAAVPACAGDAGAPLAGGETSIDDRTSDAFSFPAPNLSAEELERHFAGDVAFEAVFVSPPSPVNAGLGPLFNHTSCAGCHLRDGRGMPDQANRTAAASQLNSSDRLCRKPGRSRES